MEGAYFDVPVRYWRLLHVKVQQSISYLANDLKYFKRVESLATRFRPLLNQIEQSAACFFE